VQTTGALSNPFGDGEGNLEGEVEFDLAELVADLERLGKVVEQLEY
jgi:hypothetical protein